MATSARVWLNGLLLGRAAPSVSRREWIILGAILALALVVRLLFVHELRGDLLFDAPPLDEERYVREARRLASGLPFEPRAFWQPPGIQLVLAAIFRVLGDGLYAPRVIQAICGTLTCALGWAIARRLFDARVAFVASLIVALHGLLVFSGGELLPATWAGLLDLAALVLLLDASKSVGPAAAAGLLVGLSALFTPTVLAFAAVATTTLAFTRERRSVPWVFAAAVLAPIVPVTLRNYLGFGELVAISTNGGLNLFIGNNEHYFDTLAIRPGPRWTELTREPWQLARLSEPGAQSSWFFRRALAFWAERPLDALVLYLRKVALFFHAVEIPRDTDLYAVRAESRVLATLVGPRASGWPDGVLMPLALLGIARALPERARLVHPLSFVGAQVATCALFFASARYRVPCLPVLAIFASAALVAFGRATPIVRAKELALFVVLAIACALPAREATMASAAEREFYRGQVLRHRGDSERALDHFQRAAQAEPNDPRPWMELGNVLAETSRTSGTRQSLAAAEAWERAAAADPWDLLPARLAAEARRDAGDRAGAIRLLDASIAAGRRPPAAYAAEHVALVALHLDSGDGEAALGALRAAVAADPRYARSHAREVARDRRASRESPAYWARFDALVP